MRWSSGKRTLVVSAVLIGLGLTVCGWQAEEHIRYRRNASQALINRGRDITSTLGVVVRSQRRFGPVIWKERLQLALQDLVRPEDLESIAILAATGETIASAGQPIEVTQEMLTARGVFWHDRSVTIMNVMDLGATTTEDGSRPTAIVVDDERTARAFRPPMPRRNVNSNTVAAKTPERAPSPGGEPPIPGGVPPNAPPNSAPPNPDLIPMMFSRPSWMAKEEFEAVIRKQGVHSLVLSLSTDEMHQAVNRDLLLRTLVSLLALGGTIVSTLAWRNITRNAELQVRLIKAGEMNTHLKEMNLAAAGLAHETRNPLNLIRGLAHMIMIEAKSDTKLREHAASIIEETDRVTVQLNEFINYSKPREVQLGPVDVVRLVADVARPLLPDLEEKGIQLHPPETALKIEADEQLLRQALFNVILNATQAVASGARIDVRLTAENSREAVLEVCDDGPGVAAENRTAIFKPYVTMRPKGVGLGLAIVAQIAAAHHWEVTCVANEPKGALFRFRHLKIVPSTP